MSIAGHAVVIQNSTASGEFVQMLNHNGNTAAEFNANGSGDGIFRLMTNAGVDFIEADAGGAMKVGPGALALDFAWPLTVQGAASGNGVRVRAGENLGDIVLHLNDQDNTFGDPGGAIMQVEADQGFVTFFKTYAQTLADRGQVFGVDQQSPGQSADFNTQFGVYRIGGQRANGTIFIRNAGAGQSFTTPAVTINFDTVVTNTGTGGTGTDLYTFASNQITVNRAGTYLISYHAGASGTGVNYYNLWLENNTVEIAGSRVWGLLNTATGSTNGASITVTLAAADVIRLRIERTGGSATLDTIPGGSKLSLVRLS